MLEIYTGLVNNISNVFVRFSSAKKRIVNAGIKIKNRIGDNLKKQINEAYPFWKILKFPEKNQSIKPQPKRYTKAKKIPLEEQKIDFNSLINKVFICYLFTYFVCYNLNNF